MIYTVTMERTRDGKPKHTRIDALTRTGAEVLAEIKYPGYAATGAHPAPPRTGKGLLAASAACFLVAGFFHEFVVVDVHYPTETNASVVWEWSGTHHVIATVATVADSGR